MSSGGRLRKAAAALAAACALAAAAPASAAAPGGATLALDAGDGQTLRVQRAPFRLALVDAAGRETIATVPGREGPPVRVPGIDGPQPAEPLGPAGGFPAMAFVVGANPGITFPVSFFTGNRLFGAEAGALVSLVEVVEARTVAGGLDLAVRTDAPGVGNASLRARRLAGGGVRLELDPPPQLAPAATMFTLASPAGEGLYGLGARKDRFDQRGLLRNVWVEQQNATAPQGEPIADADPTGTLGPDYTFPNGAQAAYYVQAALHGSRGWTAWIGQSQLSRLDLAASRPDALRWGVKAPRLTLSLAGGGLEESARSYTADAGRAPPPPRYAYEPWIDVINEGEGEAAPNGQGFTGGARVRRDIEEIARRSRELGIPIGVIGVEGWQSVPGGEELFGRLRREGFRLSAYWNPFHSPGTAAYDEALRRDLFIEDPRGEPYPIVTNRGGRSFVIDYSHPGAAEFWREQIERTCRLGFEAFMHDFGELITEGMRFHNGNPPEVEHNAYPVRYHRAARAGLEACAANRRGFEPFFYVRAGYSGIEGGEGVIGSTPSVFPGDETTDWTQGSGIPSVPPAMLNLAMGGSYAFTTDVGGYLDLIAPRTSPELFARWSQLAALTAISRIHNSTSKRSVYPWTHGERIMRIYRRYARAKMRLVRLVDEWARRAARDGTIGPVRPLVLEDSSPAARSIDDQWLLGRDVLAAPVLEEGATTRRVYLPRGASWQRVVVGEDGRFLARGEPEPGGRTVTAPAPLEDMPIYLRAEGPAAQGPAARAPSRVPSRSPRRRGGRPRARGGVAAASGRLPFSGLPLAGLVAAGLASLGAGLALRRRLRAAG